MTFQTYDYILIAAYFLLVQLIGFVVARRRSHTSGSGETLEFILAGRSLTLPLFVATLVSTWYGSILGMGEFIYTSGISATVCFVLPYYVTAGIYAVFLARRIRTNKAITIPEQLSSAFGPAAGLIASVLVLVVTIPAAYVLTLGALLETILGLPLWSCIIIGSLLSVCYLLVGGLRSGVFTDVFQFVLMFLGFGILLFFAVGAYGTPDVLPAKLPASHLDPTGGYSWQYIAVWFIIACQTFVDPNFHQRCAATTSVQTAQRGIFTSIGFWLVFDTLTLLCGLYARAFIDLDTPLLAYPMLGEAVLPAFFKGLFVVSLLATVMSTLDSFSFVSGVTIGRDVLGNILPGFRDAHGEPRIALLTRVGIVLSGAIAVCMAIALPSVVQLIWMTASLVVPGLFVPMLLSFRAASSALRTYMPLVMLASSLCSALWMLARAWPEHAPGFLGPALQSVEPMLPGLLLSLVLCGALLWRQQCGRPA